MVGQVKTNLPVYLPDKTVIGSADVNIEDGIMMIQIRSDSNLAEFVAENLVGFAVVHLSDERVENKEVADE